MHITFFQKYIHIYIYIYIEREREREREREIKTCVKHWIVEINIQGLP